MRKGHMALQNIPMSFLRKDFLFAYIIIIIACKPKLDKRYGRP